MKKYHIEYVDYDPELCSEIWLDTKEEAFQYLANRALEELENVEYDVDAPSTKKLIKIIRSGKTATALLKAINDWYASGGIHVYFTMKMENPLVFPFDHEGNIERLNAILKKQSEQE